MKKYILLFFPLIVCVQIVKSQGNGFSLKELGLKGKVKQLIVITYRGDKNLDTLEHPERDTLNFDSAGNQLNEISYDKEGQLSNQMTYAYPDSRTLLMNQYFMGELTCKYVYKFDDKGNNIEFGTYTVDNPKFKFPKIDYVVYYKYNEKGNKIEQTAKSIFPGSPNKTTYVYNDRNQLAESTSYLPNGREYEKRVYQYDNLGQSINTLTYKPDGKLYSEQIVSDAKYDALGNCIFIRTIFKSHNEKLSVFFPVSIIKRQIIYFNN